jgi:uncharacterized protein (TIGR00288 family)
LEGTQGLQGRKIALLIDFDNVVLGVDDPGFDPELVVNALRSRGVVVMGRAYGDWYRHNRHRRKLMEQGIELVETPVFGPVIKNSADIRIVLDAFEIAMLQHHIDAFCLVSGDSDFLPLIKKLQYLGKHVIVISGNKFTSDLVRRNCNEFVSYENLVAESLGATEDASTLEGSFALLARGIATLHERGMEVRSSTVKQMMLQLNPAFSERNFGCAQFKQFLDKAVRAGVVKLGGRDSTSGEFMVFLPTDLDETDTDKLQEKAIANGKTLFNGPVKEKEAREPRSEPRERKTRRERSETSAETPIADVSPVELCAAAAEAPPAPSVEKTAELGEGVRGGEVRPTTAGHLLSRGMRRGRLRFSGKAGRAEIADETSGEAPAEAIEAAPEIANVTPENVPAETADEAVIEAQAIVDAIPEAQETIAAPEETAEAPAEEAEAAPKKRATRRGGKGRKTKAKADEASETPAEEQPDSVTATPAPAEVSATAAGSDAVSTPEAAIENAATQSAESPAETATEEPTAPNPIDVGIAASAPAKRRPTRRRPTAQGATKGASKAAKKSAE